MCCVSSWRRDRITIVTHTFQTLPDSYKQNRPVDPGSIQGSHRPISFTRIKHTRTIFCVKLSMNNQIVGLVHKNRNIRTCTMYHAACKVELQPFKRSYSQLMFFNFLSNHHFYFPAQLVHMRFYPQRSPGQAVVTGRCRPFSPRSTKQ